MRLADDENSTQKLTHKRNYKYLELSGAVIWQIDLLPDS